MCTHFLKDASAISQVSPLSWCMSHILKRTCHCFIMPAVFGSCSIHRTTDCVPITAPHLLQIWILCSFMGCCFIRSCISILDALYTLVSDVSEAPTGRKRKIYSCTFVSSNHYEILPFPSWNYLRPSDDLVSSRDAVIFGVQL